MAKTTRTRTRSGGEIVVVQPSAPVTRRSGGRRRSSGGGGKRRRRRRSSVGGGGASSVGTRLQHTALGGLAYGLLVKNFPSIPKIPGIGTSGTVALAVYFLKPSNKILQDLGVAAAAIAGYTFGSTGTVAGDDDGILASQG